MKSQKLKVPPSPRLRRASKTAMLLIGIVFALFFLSTPLWTYAVERDCSTLSGVDRARCQSDAGPIPPEALEVNFGDIASQQGLEEALTTIGGILGKLTPWLFTFAGIGLFVFLIMAGFSYLTSAGDPKKLESAKGRITAALIGFIVVFVAYWLVQITAYIFGLEGLKGLFGIQ